MTKARFEALEKSLGLRYNPDGLLANVHLRPHVNPMSVMTWDWVHNMLQDGTLTVEASELLRAVAPEVTNETIRQFLQSGWCFPAAQQRKGQNLWRIFAASRESAGDPSQVHVWCVEGGG